MIGRKVYKQYLLVSKVSPHPETIQSMLSNTFESFAIGIQMGVRCEWVAAKSRGSGS